MPESECTDNWGMPADGPAPAPYRGRFAPTPSGPLHLGSLLTALASWLQARSQGGLWLLRIDDLDRPRCLPGADAEILRQLEQHGLLWDESPRYQTTHVAEYEEALARLADLGLAYPCSCTRARLATSSLPGPDGPVYDGHCRHAAASGRCAIRFRLPPEMLQFHDGWLGLQRRQAEAEVGDFTLRRSDGMIGYQLACAVDEIHQGITEVVRGSDLLGSTFRQIAVMHRLGWVPPAYRHGPLLQDATGLKLSKQNHAAPLAPELASTNLLTCLRHLSQEPPTELDGAGVPPILAWALAHWRPQQLLSPASASVELG